MISALSISNSSVALAYSLHGAEHGFSLHHFFLVLDVDNFFFGDRLHLGKDLPHQLVDDAVQKMHRISCLSITNGLLVLPAITYIEVTSDTFLWIIPASGFDAGVEIQPGATVSAEHIPGKEGVSPGPPWDQYSLISS